MKRILIGFAGGLIAYGVFLWIVLSHIHEDATTDRLYLVVFNRIISPLTADLSGLIILTSVIFLVAKSHLSKRFSSIIELVPLLACNGFLVLVCALFFYLTLFTQL